MPIVQARLPCHCVPALADELSHDSHISVDVCKRPLYLLSVLPAVMQLVEGVLSQSQGLLVTR